MLGIKCRRMCRLKATVDTKAYEDGSGDIEKHLNVAKVIKTMKRVDAICKVLFTRPQTKMLQYSRKSVLPKLPKDEELETPLDWVEPRFRRIIMQETPSESVRAGPPQSSSFSRKDIAEEQVEY